MKKITKEVVRHIAFLSRLKLTQEEVETYSKQLEEILEYMDKLNKLDTEVVPKNVTHIFQMINTKINFQQNLRDDVPVDNEVQNDILSNAPEKIDKFFKVDKVIE